MSIDTTTRADQLDEILSEYQTLIERAIDVERDEAVDQQPRRITLSGVESGDMLPIRVHREESFRRRGCSHARVIWSAHLESVEDSDTLNATYRLFWR